MQPNLVEVYPISLNFNCVNMLLSTKFGGLSIRLLKSIYFQPNFGTIYFFGPELIYTANLD